MADQDFTINIRTTANTAGVEQIKAALTGLGAQVQSINAASGGGGGGGGGDLLDKAAAKIEHGIFRSAVHAIGIGVVYEMVGALVRAGEEIEKVTDELDKQGGQLVENTKLFGVMAKHATDSADVIKISDNALKKMAETQKTVNDLQQKQLDGWATFSDSVKVLIPLLGRVALPGMPGSGGTGVGDYEAARQQNINIADQNAKAAKLAAIKEVDDAQAAQNRTIDEIIEDQKKSIELEQQNAAIAKQNHDAKSYAEAINALNRYNQELEKSIKIKVQQDEQRRKEDDATAQSKQEDKDFVQEQVRRASPQARAALMNEQAAQLARDRGDQRGADLFQQSADRYKQFATPQQKEEVDVLEKLIEQNGLLREIRDSWK